MRSLLAATLLFSSFAYAWPVDVYVDAKVGEEKFQKAAGIEWADVSHPQLAAVEVLPGDEVLITGKSHGDPLVLLYGEGRMGVWKLGVCHDVSQTDGPAPGALWRTRQCGVPAKAEPTVTPSATPSQMDALLATATKSCAGARVNASSPTDKLVVHVRTEECRKALLALFRTDAFHSREVTLTFDIPVMQSQLRAIQTALDTAVGSKKVEALYAGGSLRLKGSLTTAEHKKVLWTVFENAVGRVTLDDRLVLTDKPAADAGTAKK